MDENANAAPAAETPPAAPVTPSPENWKSALPPELRESPSLADVNDIATLAKRFVDTKSLVGQSVRLPTNDAGKETIEEFTNKILGNPNLGLMKKPDPENPEAMAQVYNSLGRPEDPSGYAAPEGVDPEMFGSLAETAHELGLTKAQYERLAQTQAAAVQQRVQTITQEREQGLQQLKGEWGAAFEQKLDRSAKLVKALGGHPMLEQALVNNEVDAQTLRLLDKVASQIGGEGSQIAQQIGQVTEATMDEVRQRRDEVTRRLMSEDLTVAQRDELQKKLIAYSEQLVANAG